MTPDGFGEVKMLGRWDVVLPDYRVEHCRISPNWEEGRLLSMHAHLEPGMVLYDVGAEHGDLSALYGTWLNGTRWKPVYRSSIDRDDTVLQDGGVVLVEGSDRFWPVIRATFEANGLTPVGCFAGFASDVDAFTEGRTLAWSDPIMTIGRGLWPGWADGPCEPHHGFKSVVESGRTLPNIRFDTLAKMAGPPDALTIDVEGAELLVLVGSERILREHRPLVWVSIHPTLIAHDYPESGVLGTGDPDHERQRIIDFMWNAGYYSHHIETNHEEHVFFWPTERTGIDPRAGLPDGMQCQIDCWCGEGVSQA